MRQRSFEQLLEHAGQLSRQPLGELIRVMKEISGAQQAVAVIEAARFPHLACPDCAGRRLYRHGQANGLQRFRCRACGRTFNSLTGTPLARLRLKSKWLDYCQSLRDPATTVRRSAQVLGVDKNTTFRWRHRMLTLPRHDRQTPLTGIVEADEMYVLESQKGARQLERPPRKRGGRASKRADRRRNDHAPAAAGPTFVPSPTRIPCRPSPHPSLPFPS